MDQRRKNVKISTQLCKNVKKNVNGKLNCFKDCKFSHNNVEQLYSANKYKKRFCQFYPNKLSDCQYGQYCSFAHDHREVLIDLIHLYVKDIDFYIYHYKTGFHLYLSHIYLLLIMLSIYYSIMPI